MKPNKIDNQLKPHQISNKQLLDIAKSCQSKKIAIPDSALVNFSAFNKWMSKP